MNQINILVTFYCDSKKGRSDTLPQKYIVRGWQNEEQLRSLLDEIAHEMHDLSGYGIESIKTISKSFKLMLTYNHQLRPYDDSYYDYFLKILRFNVGAYEGSRSKTAWFELPRMSVFTPANTGISLNNFHEILFPIQIQYVKRGRKKSRQKGDELTFIRDNPTLISFQRKIYHPGILLPYTTGTRPLAHITLRPHIRIPIYLGTLPFHRTTQYKWEQARKTVRQQQKEETRERIYLEKAGIIYKDVQKKEKATQVYIIEMTTQENSSVYKIGISRTPGKRLQTLQTSSPFPLTIVHKFVAEPAEEAEARLHRTYNTQQLQGEWFQLTSEQLHTLKQISAYKDGEFLHGSSEK